MEKIEITHDTDRYENIFNVYEFSNSNEDKYAFYNITSKIKIPKNLDASVYEYYVVDGLIPLTTLSYRIYKSQYLWWIIMVVNNIKNPVKLLEPGTVIKVIKTDYLDLVFDSIKQKK